MPDPLEAIPHLDEAMRNCIANCSACHNVCMATVEHCLRQARDDAGADLIRRLLDCAQACDISRDLMLRTSPLHPRYCRGCAHACGSCASACEKFPDDDVLRVCAELCRRCMESCRAMGGPEPDGHG